jgi:very-short-patch-repair endonuclease
MPKIPKRKQIQAARVMRGNATPAEKMLWGHLRDGKPGGFKFRRQAPAGDAIADFLCSEANLVVEVDGSIHALKAASDAARTEMLERLGFQVVRFTNQEVLNETASVVRKIVALCRERVAAKR